MILQGTLLKVAAGVAAALCIGLIFTGWLLKTAWQDNATLEGNNQQLQATIASQVQAYQALEAEKQKVEYVVVENAAEKEVITRVEEKIRYEIKEIIKEVPADDCLNQSMPPALFECLQSDDCRPGAGDPDDVPA